jgi:hypothetical protein
MGLPLMSHTTRSTVTALGRELYAQEVHLLTCMDAASLLSPSRHGQTVVRAADFIKKVVAGLKETGDDIWLGEADTDDDLVEQMDTKVLNCMNYTFIQRLLMYDARQKGDSLATYRVDLAQLHSDTHIPEGFDIHEAINTLTSYHRQELDRIDELWLANVDLE